MSNNGNGRKRKLHKKKAAAFVFLGMLGLICLVNLAARDREFSERENRMLEQKPKLTLSGLESGRYMDQYEAYQSDQFAGRDLWVSLKTQVDLLMGERKSNGVFKGKDRYLLEDIAVPGEEQLQANLDAILEFESAYEDIPMYMMLVPDAANILQEKLPRFAVTEDQDAQFQAVRETLGENLAWVETGEVLKKHKKENIYYHTDHHWTTLGAYYAYQQLAETMELDASKTPQWKAYAVTSTFNGTLSSTSGYESGYREPIYIYVPEDEQAAPQVVVNYVDEQKKAATLYDRSKLEGKDKYAVFLSGNHAMVDIRTTADTTDRLLLFKDSYANCLIPFLTPYYREIIVIDARYYYGDLGQVMEENKISSVLFLYSGNTFVKDNSLSGVLQNDETE